MSKKEPLNIPELKKFSKSFEDELDEYFHDRLEDRSAKQAKNYEQKQGKEKTEIREPSEERLKSGCCYSGCHDCPWGYKATAEPDASEL